jgi:hypothetical protein
MKLPDRSPGLTIAAAFVVVYGQILVEIGMWTRPTWFTMFGTLALAIVLAIAVCSWLFDLLDEEEPVVETVSVAEAAPRRLPSPPRRGHAPGAPRDRDPRVGPAQPRIAADQPGDLRSSRASTTTTGTAPSPRPRRPRRGRDRRSVDRGVDPRCDRGRAQGDGRVAGRGGSTMTSPHDDALALLVPDARLRRTAALPLCPTCASVLDAPASVATPHARSLVPRLPVLERRRCRRSAVLRSSRFGLRRFAPSEDGRRPVRGAHFSHADRHPPEAASSEARTALSPLRRSRNALSREQLVQPGWSSWTALQEDERPMALENARRGPPASRELAPAEPLVLAFG